MHRASILFAALALTAFTAHADSKEHISRTFNVADGGTLHLEAESGDVNVTAGGSGSVNVDIVRRGREGDVTFDQRGNDVYVRARGERDHRRFSWSDSDSYHYEIHVPARFNLDLQSSGGDVEIGSVNGNVTARSSGGSIEIHRAGGPIVAHSSGGGIRIDDAADRVDATTSGGSIKARFSRQPSGDSRLSTSGGGVTVELAPAIGAELDARASGGGVHADVPITVHGTRDDDSLVGRIGGGGPRLVVRTSGGGITIRSR